MSESYRRGGTREGSLDRLFKLLANERRRRILFYLDGKEGDVASIVELIDYVVVHEAESVDDLTSDEVAIALYHKHLPKLADAGLIEYDARSRTVRYRGDGAIGEHLHAITNTGQE